MWSMLIVFVLMNSDLQSPSVSSSVISGFHSFDNCLAAAQRLQKKYDYIVVKEFTCVEVSKK